MTIALIDLGLGNLRSLVNAFDYIGHGVQVISTPVEIGDPSGLVLPGVGAFGDGMLSLSNRGWKPVLEELVLAKKRPIIGICLGMQLLASVGTEFGRWEGLGWIEGSVDLISPSSDQLRVPHVGWNDVAFSKNSLLARGMQSSECFYFAHSYVFHPEHEQDIAARTEYGGSFTSVVERENIFGVQFHPEKSHAVGLKMLRNFCTLV